MSNHYVVYLKLTERWMSAVLWRTAEGNHLQRAGSSLLDKRARPRAARNGHFPSPTPGAVTVVTDPCHWISLILFPTLQCLVQRWFQQQGHTGSSGEQREFKFSLLGIKLNPLPTGGRDVSDTKRQTPRSEFDTAILQESAGTRLGDEPSLCAVKTLCVCS